MSVARASSLLPLIFQLCAVAVQSAAVFLSSSDMR